MSPRTQPLSYFCFHLGELDLIPLLSLVTSASCQSSHILMQHAKEEGKETGQRLFSSLASLLLWFYKIFLETARRLPLSSHWPVLGHMPTHRPITADQSLAKGRGLP